MKKTTLDELKDMRLTEAEISEMKRDRDVRNIDLTDIHELTPEYLATLKRIVPPDRYKISPRKKQITLKIDADVIDAFKATGKGYQTRINEVLRKAFENGTI